MKSYSFWEESTRWVVNHGMNTRSFTESIRNDLGQKLNANIRIIDANKFWVEFTEPETGTISVTFDLSGSVNLNSFT